MITPRTAPSGAQRSRTRASSGDALRILHLVDSLDVGGTERVAVNLSNLFATAGHAVTLCTTRRDGPLARDVEDRVARLCLERRFRFQPGPLRRLLATIDHRQIEVIHAHSTSLFVAASARRFRPGVKIVWHDHYGRSQTHQRRAWLYRRARPDAVISVNRRLRSWADRGRVQASERLHYLPNFTPAPNPRAQLEQPLPGAANSLRVVIAANLRPQKGHEVLLEAFALAHAACPGLELLACGGGDDERYSESLRAQTARLGIERSAHFLGNRDDLEAVLATSDIAVLSSHSEGLPLALLEYGRAGLPVIVTDVGDCAEVLENGRHGLLVAPGDPQALACALVHLAQHPRQRAWFGHSLSARVASDYSADATMEKLLEIYRDLTRSHEETS